MDRLKTQNLHYKRVLDRQITDLETLHRQSEQKRQREVRRLGVDLAKLHKSTRDVDDVIVNTNPTAFATDNSPKASTPRRASFSGFSTSIARPLTSPALISGRRRSTSVTSSVAHLLSRSRQELTSLSLTPSPKTPRRHSVFDFGHQQQNTNTEFSLPEIRYSESFDNIDNNNTNNINNHLHHHIRINDHSDNSAKNNNINNYRNNSYSDCKISPRNQNKPSSGIVYVNKNNHSIDNLCKISDNERPSIAQRRHSLAGFSRQGSVTINISNTNINTKHDTKTNDFTDKKNNSSKDNENNKKNNNNLNCNSSNNNITKTMTVGNERRGSETTIADIKTQASRRSSLGNRGTAASFSNSNSNVFTTTNNSNKTSKTLQEPQNATMAGKSPTRLTTRRGSTDSNSSSSSLSPRLRKNFRKLSLTAAEEVSHNETVVLIHRDDDEPEMISPESSKEGSMFSRKPKRRASEPAVGGQFLRSLQNYANGAQNHNGNGNNTASGGNPLRQAIEEELPSGIVAEEDEDIYNKETEEKNNLDKNDGQNSTKPSTSSEMSLSSSSSSISSSKTKTSQKEKNGNAKQSESAESNGKPRQARRKSEGDVLRFARIWRLHAGNPSSLKELMEEKKEEPIKPPPKDDIWDAVRKCRYIRGYTPADMSEPSDLREYVFGHQAKDPSTATK